jgi:hypothetical protein
LAQARFISAVAVLIDIYKTGSWPKLAIRAQLQLTRVLAVYAAKQTLAPLERNLNYSAKTGCQLAVVKTIAIRERVVFVPVFWLVFPVVLP